MKILIAHHHLDFLGGAELVVARLANYLIKQGVSTTIAALSQPLPGVADFKGLNIITPARQIPYRMIAVGVSDYFELIRKVNVLRKLIQREMDSYDLINVHNFPAPWTLFPKRRPSVWMCNEPPDLWHNTCPSLLARVGRQAALMVDRFMIRQSINVGCVADELNAHRFRQRYGMEPRVIPYGIDYDFFSRRDGTDIRDNFDLDGKFILLQVGQITPSKNQMASLRVIKNLRDKIKNIRLILAGLANGSYAQLLREYIYKNNLEQYVVFTGHLSREELRGLYHACNVTLFPVHTQGSWLSPFEALCASKPVVVSNELTSSKLIHNEQIGIVTDDMETIILDINRNPEGYDAMAYKGKQFVAEHLTWNNYCKGMLNVFKEVLSVS